MSMKSNAAIDRLHSLNFWWLKNGLQGLKKIFRYLWNPQDKLQVIHVAGTNGKWSVCAMISQVLQKQCSYKIWVFSSPHLIVANERITINGEYISDDDFNIFLWQAFDIADTVWVQISFFEAVFLCSILYFVYKKINYAVIEVWLGGTLDATNVFAKPLATCITSIWFDHTHILWATKSQIQRNKMWIMKKWVSCFTPVDNALMSYAAKIKRVDLHVVKTKKETNLDGKHQETNAWVAYEILRYLWVSKQKIHHWLQEIIHRWRCERLANNLLIDWAHNVEWLLALREYVRSISGRYSRIITAFGCVKKVEEFEQHIKPYLIQWNENYYITIDSERNLSYIHITNLSFSIQKLDSTNDFFDNIYITGDKKTLFIVYWSLYLMGEMLSAYQKLN